MEQIITPDDKWRFLTTEDVPFLVISGYSNDEANHLDQQLFHNLWAWNTPFPCVIVDNAQYPLVVTHRPDIRVLRMRDAIGHNWKHFRGKAEPYLGGWSVAWLLGGWIAYSERKDMLFKEQDCLAFGDWVDHIYGVANERNADVVYGEGSAGLSCEQSIFLVRWRAIPHFFSAYTAFEEGDGIKMPEDKFEEMAKRPGNPHKMAKFNLPGGRTHPMPTDNKTWYGQQFTRDELAQALSKCPLRPPVKLAAIKTKWA